ncbi:MAG TPA: ABC transporter permease [Candidatus Xenobia bacterium]
MIRRSLMQHALSTIVTVLSVALASGLVMAVIAVNAQAYDAFTGGETGFDAVVGARGSQLQLVLNTVFHLETSPGNIPWSIYVALQHDPRVALAVPYAIGDNYLGYRIVGTTDDIFTQFEYREGERFQVQPGGRVFNSEAVHEAVVGSFVAAKTGLQVGSVFNPFHGLDYDPNMRHDEHFTVVGILKPTNSPSDRVIWIPIEGVYRMKGHVLRGSGKEYTPQAGQAIPDEDKEVSAVMLKLTSPIAGFTLDQTINRQGKVATLAWPVSRVMADLFDKIGWMSKILTVVAMLVVLVATGSILASIYNTVNERRREFAIQRALGASQAAVFSSVVTEAAAIAGVGSLLGLLVYLAIMYGSAWVIRAQTGVVLYPWHFDFVLIVVPVAVTALGAAAGMIPAIRAYRTEVASNLTPLS